MCAHYNSVERNPIETYYYSPQNITDDTIEDKTLHDLKAVESYKFINQQHDVKRLIRNIKSHIIIE